MDAGLIIGIVIGVAQCLALAIAYGVGKAIGAEEEAGRAVEPRSLYEVVTGHKMEIIDRDIP